MATTKRTRKTDSDAPPAGPPIEDVEDMLDIAGDETHLLWFLRSNGQGGWAHLASVKPAPVRALGIREYARDRWGGGQFKARLRTVTSQWVVTRTFDVEGAAKVATHTEPRDDDRSRGRDRRDTPTLHPLVEQLAIPVLTSFGVALAKKLLDDPKPDPLLIELLRKSGNGGTDPLELQRAIAEAEARGEARGRELGQLTAEVDNASHSSNGESSSGVVTAIREATGLIQTVMTSRDGGAPKRRRIAASTPVAVVAAPGTPTADANGEDSLKTIPEWLQPFMVYRLLLIQAADRATSAGPIAGLIVENADDATWAAIVDGDGAGRLEADLFAAVPELTKSDRRKAFVEDLVTALHAAIEDQASDGGEEGDDAAAAGDAGDAGDDGEAGEDPPAAAGEVSA